MIDLRDEDNVAICDIAEKCFKTPIEIWAYGSRVNGDSHDASDLDLVIRTDNLKSLAWRNLAAFQEQLRDSNIPILIQAFDWAKLPKSFHTNILEKYEVIFSNFKKFELKS